MRSASDAAGWVRLARRIGAALNSDPEYLPLDPANGALVVTGAGAAPSATSLRLAGGAAASGEAEVVAGRVQVADQHAQAQTDAQARATPLPVQTQAGLALDATTDAVRGLLVPVRDGSVRDQGAPWYQAGAGGGSYTLTAGQRLLGLTAQARGTDGTVTVAGGPAITVRAGASFAWEPRGNYTDGTAVVFSASLDWMVEGVA